MKESDLIVNKDGSIYHLYLKPEHIADTVILVGDQGRVDQISHYFDKIEYSIQNREFKTHTGYYRNQRITAISSGIGTDNIDIVMNELDAVINMDLHSRRPLKERKSLKIVRIGTSGSLQADIHVGSYVISEYGLGFDGLIYYYNYIPENAEKELADQINQHLNWDPMLATPYVVKGSEFLVSKLGKDMVKGITATATGFYGPQGRRLYLRPKEEPLLERLESFQMDGHRITNFEMETSAIYGLGKLLGHQCCTCCVIIANRKLGESCQDYKKIVEDLIELVLDRLVEHKVSG